MNFIINTLTFYDLNTMQSNRLHRAHRYTLRPQNGDGAFVEWLKNIAVLLKLDSAENTAITLK